LLLLRFIWLAALSIRTTKSAPTRTVTVRYFRPCFATPPPSQYLIIKYKRFVGNVKSLLTALSACIRICDKMADGNYKTVTVRLPAALVDRVDALSDRIERSRSWVVRRCLERDIEQCERLFGRDGQGTAQPVRRTTKKGDAGAAQNG
jgi:predicted DNA-binding protein